MSPAPARAAGPVRVCLVMERLDIAGGPRLFEHLVRRLDPSEFRVSVATSPQSPLAGVFEGLGARIEPVSFSRALDPRSLLSLRRLFSREGFDIVHPMGLRADFHARLAARLGGRCRVVSTVAMMAMGFDVAPWRRRLYDAAERLSERWVGIFITDSEFTRRRLVSVHGVPPERVETVYIGCDPADFEPAGADRAAVRRSLGLADGPVIASVGRLVDQKGHADFLHATALLARSSPGLQALVVGDGPLRPELEALAAGLGLGAAARFLPARRAIRELLAALDALVIASHAESIPTLLYEAMAMGLPIVATAVGGIPEAVADGEHALVVPPGRPELLAGAAERLLRRPAEAREMGLRARRRVIERFNIADCVSSVARCYRKALDLPHSG